MRKETVSAKNEQEALEQCPWASRIAEVDNGYCALSGEEDIPAYMCFESVDDYDMWMRQI